MPEIKPFKGLLYDPDKIEGDYSLVCAPPYDVISPSLREKLYGFNDHNIVRLTLPEATDEDTETDNKYIRAGQLLSSWIKDNVLKQSEEESFYVYVQEYDVEGNKSRRVGFVGLMKIDEPGEVNILPHEHTLAKPKKDRMALIKEVVSDLSSIFSIYSDDNGEIKKIIDEHISSNAPVIDIDLDDGRHMLWSLSDAAAVGKISTIMRGKKVFIADGHHRYEVAKNYRDSIRARGEDERGAGYVMTYFADMNETDNLTVFATHRAVKKMPRIDISSLEDSFDILECSGLDELSESMAANKLNKAVGFVDKDRYCLLTLKREVDINDLIQEKRSLSWKNLDVSILHSVIFKLLDVKNEEGNIVYIRQAEEAVSLLKKGECEGVFLLNPTPVDQLRDVALNGDMMPQKSTYFYPKLLTGLVMYRFGDIGSESTDIYRDTANKKSVA